MTQLWPNFFIVGVARCGTTSLYEYLIQHPQVFMSPVKEPRFFSRLAFSGSGALAKYHEEIRTDREADYLRLFAGVRQETAIGEASPDYLRDPQAPYRIRERLPHARIIVTLRDPIERAFSAYHMLVRLGVETMPFYQALFGEFGPGYVEVGRYAEPVGRYLEVFGREQVLVLMFEDLKKNSVDLLGRVADFLGIDRRPVASISLGAAHNPYVVPRNRLVQHLIRRQVWIRHHLLLEKMPKSVRSAIRRTLVFKKATKPRMDQRAVEYLKPIYEPDILELEALLGEPLPDLRKTWQS